MGFSRSQLLAALLACFSLFSKATDLLTVTRTTDLFDLTTGTTTETRTMDAEEPIKITVREQLRRTEYVYRVPPDATVMDLKEAICRGDPENGVPPGPAPQQMTLYQQRVDEEDEEKQKAYIPKHTDKLGRSFCDGDPDEGHFMVFIMVHKYFA